MELGTEISQKLKKTIKKQLQTLGSYVDDELPEYIMVMIANKRTKEQMVEDLHLFLNDEAGKFVNWLLGVLEKIQIAIQLTCINDEPTESADGDSISEDGSPIKIKKKAKKNDIEGSSKKKQEEKPKRKFTEKRENKVNRKNSINGDRKEGAHSDSKEKRRRSNSRSNERRRSRSRSKGRRRSRSKSRRRSRSKSKGRRHLRSRSKDRRGARSRSKDRRRESSRSNVRRRSRSRSKDRRHSLTGRGRKRSKSVERERSTSQEKKPSQETIKQQNLTERKHSLDKGEITKTNISASPNELESFSKEELHHRNEREHNPMDFVKRIAKDINAKLAGKQATREEVQLKGEVKLDSVEASVEKKGKVKESSDVIEASSHENVSLQAVGQYEDGDNNDHDKIVKSLDKKVNEDENNKPRERKEFSRSRSPRRRNRSRSRSPAKRRNRRYDERRTRRSRSLTKREDVKRSSVGGRNSRRRSYDEHKDNEKHREKHSSHEHRKTKEEKKHREKIEKETDKDKLASEINVANDLKKKPALGKSLQASSALLKKAMNEAVSETQKKSIEDVGEVEESVGEELDYSEDIDDTLHIGKESKDFNDDRRVIDFNQKSQGLATITINFKSPNESESDEEKANENRDEDDIALRKGLLQDMSKMDARYAIIKSRLDQKDDKRQSSQREVGFDRHGGSAPKEKPRFLGSMIADLEEESTKELKKRHKYERRQDRQRLIESERHKRAGRGRHRNRGRGSSDEEVLSAEQVQRLTDESHRIKLQELKRNMISAREGDLRSLLDGKRRRESGVTKTKSSDDEETVERKLREKIKEEKHMRLFGKLNRGDRDRLSKERQELRLKLEKARRRQRKHSDRETRRSSRKSDLGDKKTEENDHQIDESSGSDQWVETEAPLQPVDKGVEGDEDGVSDWDEAPTQNRSYILEQEVLDEHEEEEQIDQLQINEEEKDKKSEKEEEIEISKDVLLASVHKEEKSKLEAENENLDSEKKQENKRKKIRQEFIVTLDGFEKGKEKQDIEEAKRSRRQPSDRKHKRKNSSSFTQSDEEFEEILRKKQKEEEEAKHRHHSSRRSRRSHRSRKSRSPSPNKEELDDIDREIMIAEKKLKAQKLLKKSLDQVQSLNTESFTFENNKPKTAFVNPHFKPKVDIPVMNVVPLNVSGQPIVAQHPIPPVAAPLSVLPSQSLVMLQQQQQQQQNLTNLVTHISNKSTTAPTIATAVEHVEDSSSDQILTTHPLTPTDSLPSKVTVMATSTSDVTSPTFDKKKTTITEHQTSIMKQILPSQCQMIGTRKIPCNIFPNCTFGKRCAYSHPVCKFGERCTNMHCIYNHEKITTVGGLNATMCKFYPNCMNSSCPYKHPIQKSCRFGTNCTNNECLFIHDNTSDTKWIAAKPHISERKFAVDNGVVSNPVSIVTTPTSETKPHTDEET